MAGKPVSTRTAVKTVKYVRVTFEGPSEFLYEPDTGQTVARGESASFPHAVALRLKSDRTVSVTLQGE